LTTLESGSTPLLEELHEMRNRILAEHPELAVTGRARPSPIKV
jgi:hypothetical protein